MLTATCFQCILQQLLQDSGGLPPGENSKKNNGTAAGLKVANDICLSSL